MGRHFGDPLAFVRGIIYYRLSPHELKPFAGTVKYGLPNFVPRTTATLLTWLPQFVGCWILMKTLEMNHYQRNRKDLKDYANEVEPEPPKPPPTETIIGPENQKKKC